jgi:large subunit ribosomal protein L18
MSRAKSRKQVRRRIRHRVRAKVHGTASRPRLAVFRSLKHIYAQAIDDEQGRTIAWASSREASIRDGGGSGVEMAKKVGALIADRVKEAGVENVVFDRGGFLYHGRVKALAEAGREAGLKF